MAIIAAPLRAADEPLRWKFRVGEQLKYTMAQKMWVLTTLGAPAKNSKDPQISWGQYVKDCGPGAQKADDAASTKVFNEKYKDKPIQWTGRVDSITAKPTGKGYAIVVNMDPTEPEPASSRITLHVTETPQTQVAALKTGDIAKFTAKLVKQARQNASHEAQATEISPEQSMSMAMQQEMEMTWDVQGVDEASGEAVIRQKFDRLKTKMTTPGSAFEYDSTSEQPPGALGANVAPMYKAMTESEFEITMTARGEVKDVKIPEQVLTVLKNQPGAAAMGDVATPDGFKKIISQGALILPKDPPKPGESWNSQVEVNNPKIGKQLVETKYFYEGTTDIQGQKYALIRPRVTMTFENAPPPAPAASQPQQPAALQPMQLKVKEQNSNGEVLFNIQEGRLYSTSLKQDVTIESSELGRVMLRKIDQKIDVKVTPAVDSKPKK